MTLKKKILIRICFLTFLIILAMSVTYYYLFTREIRDSSNKQIAVTYEIIFDDLKNRTTNVLSKIDQFIQSSLASPMYVVQILLDQYHQSNQAQQPPPVRKMITYLSAMSRDIAKFGELIDAIEILVYDKNKNLLAVYRQEDTELMGIYFSSLQEGAFVLAEAGTKWYGSTKGIETLPQVPLPGHISPVYQDDFPSTIKVTFDTLKEMIAMKLIIPIIKDEETSGVCVLYLGIYQEDVERYSRLTKTEVNIFTGDTVSAGTLTNYTALPPEIASQEYQTFDLLYASEHSSVLVTESTIGKQSYYHGVLLLGNDHGQVGAITVLLPRQFAEQRENNFFKIVAGITLLFSILAIGEAYGLSAMIVRPITSITSMIRLLAQGDLDAVSSSINKEKDSHQKILSTLFRRSPQKKSQTKDELQILALELEAMVKYLQDIAHAANQISCGAMKQTILSRSERDVLGKAFHNMTEYLHEVAALAEAIAQGNLQVKISLRSECDAFGLTMHTMIEGLQSLILQIRTSAEQIASTGNTIASLTENDISIVQKVQTSVREMVSTMIEMGNSVEAVTHNMETLLASVEETFHAVSTVTDFSTNIASNTNKLAQQTQKTIISIDESIKILEQVTGRTEILRELSQETIQDAFEGQQAVEQVRTSMDTIQKTNLKTVETMTRFELLPREIGGILEVIENITEQSSMLALNASIIAAQAGSHGKGFSIIAEEMKNLANGVSASTKNIAAIVQTVQQETNSVVQMIHEGTSDIEQGMQRTLEAQQTLQKIISSVRRTSEVVTEIADTLRQQSITNRDILHEIDCVRSMTDEITDATDEQKTSTIQINEAVKHILDMASQTQEVANQQLRGVQQVLNTVANTISTLTDQNLESSSHINRTTTADLAEQSQILLKVVARFQVETPEENRALSS